MPRSRHGAAVVRRSWSESSRKRLEFCSQPRKSACHNGVRSRELQAWLIVRLGRQRTIADQPRDALYLFTAGGVNGVDSRGGRRPARSVAPRAGSVVE